MPENPEPLLRHVGDTARWVAYYRALETERPDALFRDPFARKLAGERGKQVAEALGARSNWTWPFTSRTLIIDRMIEAEIAAGTDMVLSLAAGLDARPYRMNLPAEFQWVEVDRAEMIDDKESLLSGEQPRCQVNRFRCDLADASARKNLLTDLASRARRICILSEGLLPYLAPEDVRALGLDLAAMPSAASWIADIYHPRILGVNKRGKMGKMLTEANAQFRFAPVDGIHFFDPLGWHCTEAVSTLTEARRIGRLPWILRIFAAISERRGDQHFTWSAICRFTRTND